MKVFASTQIRVFLGRHQKKIAAKMSTWVEAEVAQQQKLVDTALIDFLTSRIFKMIDKKSAKSSANRLVEILGDIPLKSNGVF